MGNYKLKKRYGSLTLFNYPSIKLNNANNPHPFCHAESVSVKWLCKLKTLSAWQTMRNYKLKKRYSSLTLCNYPSIKINNANNPHPFCLAESVSVKWLCKLETLSAWQIMRNYKLKKRYSSLTLCNYPSIKLNNANNLHPFCHAESVSVKWLDKHFQLPFVTLKAS